MYLFRLLSLHCHVRFAASWLVSGPRMQSWLLVFFSVLLKKLYLSSTPETMLSSQVSQILYDEIEYFVFNNFLR